MLQDGSPEDVLLENSSYILESFFLAYDNRTPLSELDKQ